MNRRRFVVGAGSALAGASVACSGPIWASDGARSGEPLAITDVGERLFVVSGGGGNVTVFHPDEGVLLVDGGSMALSPAVLDLVRKRTGKPAIHTVFNTHWHWDQTGSNLALGRAGTRIISHENTRLWLGVTVNSKWENRKYPPLPVKARPNQTFYTPASLTFGGARIDYALMPEAHTDGDIFVHFREANVLVGGDVVAVGSYPILDTASNGWITGNLNGVTTLKGICNDGTRVVPGKGAVQAVGHLEAQRAMLTTVRQRMAKMLAQGMSAQEMIDAHPSREFDAAWGDPELFIRNAFIGISLRPQTMGISVV